MHRSVSAATKRPSPKCVARSGPSRSLSIQCWPLLLMLNEKNRYATVVGQAAQLDVGQEKLGAHFVDCKRAFLVFFVPYCRMRMNLATKVTP